VKKGFVIRTWN